MGGGDVAARWREWQQTPWGRLRYTLADALLARHLDGERLRVLDVGGGDGGDAMRLAARGHHVTIVDRSAEMVAGAEERAATAGFADLIDCVAATATDLPAQVVAGAFDVVVCHNVIQYFDDVRAGLRSVLAPLRSGGLFSIIALNKHSPPLALAVREMDPRTALARLDDDHARSETLDATYTLLTAEQVRATLADLGCTVQAHYGIRAVCDYMTDDDRKYDPEFFAQVQELELALSDRMPYPHIARMFQLIGTR
ncbi:methyltransferase domain-containing protein [Nocardia sp. NPDC052566]|uniref:methyltransferase domain-containing protein n=1 Tax=Nocardia sp. NPDC052566 TaxID=3364330 RepID=UPI0037CAA3BD